MLQTVYKKILRLASSVLYGLSALDTSGNYACLSPGANHCCSSFQGIARL
jgi:hypothetical protein